MNFRMLLAALLGVLAAPFLAAQNSPATDTARYSMDDFTRVEKIDVHFHIRTDDPGLVDLARKEQFRFLNVVVHVPDAGELAERHRVSFAQQKAHPAHIAVASAFPLAGWDDPSWAANTIRYLDQTFEKGAVAVKVWKDIGMVFRDANGKLVMIDHPQFDPVFDHLRKKGIVLMGHLGEPRNCWLPLDEMTVNNDRSYFSRNPQYHMFKHPEMPSYQDQIDARDRMLARNPELHFLAAHLASLEWSVDEVAGFLDRFPNAMTETAARIGQVQYQSQRDREKVRQFFIKYQDRILYGTDGGFKAGTDADEAYASNRERWIAHWKYFCTDENQSVPELDDPVRGLALPREVIDKLYHFNARKLFPNSWKKNSP